MESRQNSPRGVPVLIFKCSDHVCVVSAGLWGVRERVATGWEGGVLMSVFTPLFLPA